MAKKPKIIFTTEEDKIILKIHLTFTEPLLGTLAGNPELVEEFIASNHPDGIQADEIEAIPEKIEKASTVFSRNDKGGVVLWDYQIKGFFKDACGMLNRTKTHRLKAHKKIIDGLIFVTPRKIELNLPVINEDGEPSELTWTERPLRAQTAQGERIALARSETAPAGTTIEFEILILNSDYEKLIKQWLDYGALRGLGQWRNSGCGRFLWEEVQ